MNRYTIAVLSFLLWSNCCPAQETDTTAIFNNLFKCWRAISHVYSPIYGLEEEEITTYSRQKVCFTRDSISMYSGSLYSPQYSIKKVHAETYAKENFDCDKAKLGIVKDIIYEIDISSFARSAKDGALHKMTDVIIFDGFFIFIVKDGVIFKLYDANYKGGPRSAN